ncbi:MAG: sensor histidine kinase [Lachnospiraceae bacterium]|nr:sensor histidine kinase [Lachnospiraceae bacterium]
MLDAMFASYFATAEADGIRIEASLDVPKDLRVSAAELSTVFANALENAIKAVRKLPKEQRVIRCKCIRYPQVMFSVSNPYEGQIRFDDDGRPIASESASIKGHGVGTASIAAYCEKYGAFCEYEAMDGWFTLRVMQP